MCSMSRNVYNNCSSHICWFSFSFARTETMYEWAIIYFCQVAKLGSFLLFEKKKTETWSLAGWLYHPIFVVTSDSLSVYFHVKLRGGICVVSKCVREMIVQVICVDEMVTNKPVFPDSNLCHLTVCLLRMDQDITVEGGRSKNSKCLNPIFNPQTSLSRHLPFSLKTGDLAVHRKGRGCYKSEGGDIYLVRGGGKHFHWRGGNNQNVSSNG